MNLKVDGESKKINVGILPLGSAGWPYVNAGYKYNWKIEFENEYPEIAAKYFDLRYDDHYLSNKGEDVWNT